MREILFRGKQIDNGEWVCGMPWIFKEKSCVCPWKEGMCKYDTGFFPVEVIPETVGQYTGLTDKNGKKIFEGDILDCKSGLYERCEVIFNEFCSAFQLMCADGYSDFFLSSINHEKMEVIGNVHDNPELLGGE